MRSEGYSFSGQFVINHQYGPVYKFKLIVPKNVEEAGPSRARVSKEPRIVHANSDGFLKSAGLLVLVPSQIQKVNKGTGMKMWTIQRIAADEVNAHIFR